jgi:hypothetical protein
MNLSPMEPNVSGNYCLGLESIRVCKLHEKRPSAAWKKSRFTASNQMSGWNYVVNDPDSSIRTDQRSSGYRGYQVNRYIVSKKAPIFQD